MQDSKTRRHVGKFFKILPGDELEVLALCVYWDPEYGYLLKFFPNEISDPSEEIAFEDYRPFFYAHGRLDAWIRAKKAVVLSKISDFSPYHPLLRHAVGPNQDGKITKWVVFNGEIWRDIDRNSKELRSMSERAIWNLPAVLETYVEGFTREELFDKMEENSRQRRLRSD